MTIDIMTNLMTVLPVLLMTVWWWCSVRGYYDIAIVARCCC